MFAPSEGDIKIFGYDIETDIYEIRRSMGVCQQFDVLFNELTIYDHLYLAFAMKGLEIDEVNLNQCMHKVGLELDDKLKSVEQLSGGMKRKLSLSMAITGNPKLLFLDEPTSAMDTEIRSQVRQIIAQLKVDSTIILTTQHMDEAEELADNIALLSKGKLHTEGTVDSIKKEFGVGYNLTFTPKYENDID